MSTEQIFTFNDLNYFCDQIILETQKWREVLAIQTEEYTELVKNNENACAKLWEIHQNVNVLGYLQEKLHRDLCECEGNYNAILQQVADLESKMIDNENCVNTPQNSVYQTVAYLNTVFSNLEGFVNNVEANVNEQENSVEKSDDLPSYALLISKQLQLLESLERKMHYICNEIKHVDGLQKMIVEEIAKNLNSSL